MKIIFFAPRMHTNTIGWSEALIAQGASVIYHVCYIGGTECHRLVHPQVLPQSVLSKVLVSFFGSGGGDIGNVFPSLIYYFRLLLKEMPDILVIRNPLRFGSLIAIICGKLLGVKILIYTQSHFEKWSKGKASMAVLLVKLIDGAWFSPVFRPEDGNNIPARFYFLPFVVGEDFQPQEGRSGKNRTKIVTIGKYKSQRKNHTLLLQALKALNSDGCWSLEIIGECHDQNSEKNYKKLLSIAQEFSFEADIKLMENVPYSDIPKIFSGADLFILPASNEPAAISVLEALASGVPVICSDSCGTRVYVEDSMPELIFKTNDVNDLSRKIETVISSELRLQDYKYKARQTKVLFSPDGFKERLRTILKEVWGVDFEYQKCGKEDIEKT